jgi:hypothetical protein
MKNIFYIIVTFSLLYCKSKGVKKENLVVNNKQELEGNIVYSPPIKRYVSEDHINFRESPNATAAVISRLSKGVIVELLESERNWVTIGKWRGHWAKIRSDGKIGWVLDTFLFDDFLDFDSNSKQICGVLGERVLLYMWSAPRGFVHLEDFPTKVQFTNGMDEYNFSNTSFSCKDDRFTIFDDSRKKIAELQFLNKHKFRITWSKYMPPLSPYFVDKSSIIKLGTEFTR